MSSSTANKRVLTQVTLTCGDLWSLWSTFLPLHSLVQSVRSGNEVILNEFEQEPHGRRHSAQVENGR